MLRPATPLMVLFVAAFVLLLLPTLSAPTVPSIPLAIVGKGGNSFTFGLFGYCRSDGTCSKYKVGYSTNSIDGFDELSTDFNLPEGIRNSLSAILIVHPVAAFMTLICVALAVAAHFHAPAHSPRYLLGVLIFTFPTLLVTLLAFLVDILLFVPHLKWAGWLVLGATILITACSVLICAMRRTLVSRKARKRRIAENADMNGSSYYAGKPAEPVYAPEPQYARADSPPPLAPGSENKLPQFATYESADDRTPLNAREPSLHTVSTNGGRSQQPGAASTIDGSRAALASSTPGSGPRHYQQQQRPHSPVSPVDGEAPMDQYGNAMGGPSSRGGYPGSRGRGGLPPAAMMYGRGGRGYPPPRGGLRGRGGPNGGPPPGWYGRGGYPARGPFRGGMRGPPQPGMGPGGPGYMGPAAVGAGVGVGAMGYGRGGYHAHQAPPGYGNNDQEMDVYQEWAQSSHPQGQPPNGYPGGPGTYPGAASVQSSSPMPPHDVAAPPRELPSRSGVASPDGITRDPASFGFSGPRGMSPARTASSTPIRRASPPPPLPINGNSETHAGPAIEMDAMPPGSYGPEVHGEPATGSAIEAVEMGETTPRLGHSTPAQQQHGGAAAADAPGALQRSNTGTSSAGRKSSDAYYEDVAPRFAQDEPLPPHAAPQASVLPSTLVPGYVQSNPHNQHLYAGVTREPSGASSHYSERFDSGRPSEEAPGALDVMDRTRSPAQSDTSNFTSISQRGVNPHWQPDPSEIQAGAPRSFRGGPSYAARGRPSPAAEAILAGPDSAVPGAGPNRGRGHQHNLSGSDGGRYPAPGAL